MMQIRPFAAISTPAAEDCDEELLGDDEFCRDEIAEMPSVLAEHTPQCSEDVEAGRSFSVRGFALHNGESLPPFGGRYGAGVESSRKVLHTGGLMLALAVLAVCAVCSATSFKTSAPDNADVAGVANKGLAGGLKMLDAFVKSVEKASEIATDAEEAMKDAQSEMNEMKELAVDAAGNDQPEGLNDTQKALLAAQVRKGEAQVEKDLTPNENTTDGNICADDEELYLTLCYKTCKQLTNGAYPLRSAPNQCCAATDLGHCDIFHVKTTAEPCGGFEVSGDREGKSGCPNPPGSCLSNEETYGGICYKKCKYLSRGRYPFRSGPDSCCKVDPTKNGLACMFGLFNHDAKTELSYGVGGGAGDNSWRTPASPHQPLLYLTEAKTR